MINDLFLKSPVITGSFQPKFYWTGNSFLDAERINRPHIKKEGEQENRIEETVELLSNLNLSYFELADVFNIQNALLKKNNWKGIKPGIRTHNVKVGSDTPPDFKVVPELLEKLFPVHPMDKESLLEWYKQVQMIHPLSDLNGRVFGIIVSALYHKHLT